MEENIHVNKKLNTIQKNLEKMKNENQENNVILRNLETESVAPRKTKAL